MVLLLQSLLVRACAECQQVPQHQPVLRQRRTPPRCKPHGLGNGGVLDDEPVLNEVVDGPTIEEFQHVVRRIPVADHVFEYAAALVRATRPDEPDARETMIIC